MEDLDKVTTVIVVYIKMFRTYGLFLPSFEVVLFRKYMEWIVFYEGIKLLETEIKYS